MANIENVSCAYELETFGKIIENFPLSIQTYNPEGLCIDCNKAWEKTWNSERKMAIGKFNILKDTQMIANKLLPKLKLAFGGKKIYIPAILHELPEKSKSEGIYIDTWYYPIFDKQKKLIKILAVHQDVTESKLTEAKEIKSIEKLETEVKKLNDLVQFNESEIEKLKTMNGVE